MLHSGVCSRAIGAGCDGRIGVDDTVSNLVRSKRKPSSRDLAQPPLVVDLDGTLIRSDLLYESFFSALAKSWSGALKAVLALRSGKAALKRTLGDVCDIDYATLPYNQAVLDLIARAKADGRNVVLATAADAGHAQAIADHLKLFDEVLASEGAVNLSAKSKANALVAAYGDGGFDYVGNAAPDLKVWKHARNAYAVDAPGGVLRRLAAQGKTATVVETPRAGLKVWLKAIRVHQYAKNVLVFVPLLTSHSFNVPAFIDAGLAFVAFCLCASSVYLINDLLDLKSDRAHASKRRRPLASGAIQIRQAMILAPALLIAAAAIAVAVGPPFVLALSAYFVLTCAYSFYLKRRLLVDVVTLSMLYAARIFGGASAIDVEVSQWLLGFSLFLFTSLALMKRYVELAARIDRSLADPSDRNYRLDDLPIVAALAAGTGVSSVLVLSLYVASPEIQANYARPQILWLMCPILLYWIGRALMMAHRRDMNDDPIVFALTDRNSRIALVCFMAIFAAASLG